MELVALLGKGEGTWGQVAGVINHHDWEKHNPHRKQRSKTIHSKKRTSSS